MYNPTATNHKTEYIVEASANNNEIEYRYFHVLLGECYETPDLTGYVIECQYTSEYGVTTFEYRKQTTIFNQIEKLHNKRFDRLSAGQAKEMVLWENDTESIEFQAVQWNDDYQIKTVVYRNANLDLSDTLTLMANGLTIDDLQMRVSTVENGKPSALGNVDTRYRKFTEAVNKARAMVR